jgi:DNA repair protein RadC
MSTPSYEIRVQRLNEVPDAPQIETPEQAVSYWHGVIARMPWFIADREVCVAVTLNTRLRATGHSLVSIGSLNESVAHPREVFRAAIAMNAFSVLLMHNHPSGDPTPSDADHRMTRRMAEAATVLQIGLMDHVIVGEGRRFSFKEGGVL